MMTNTTNMSEDVRKERMHEIERAHRRAGERLVKLKKKEQEGTVKRGTVFTWLNM